MVNAIEYDAETGFYYLNSRYYDPEIGRFINADGAISGVAGDVLGNNMYAYCFNNPINLSDSNGNWPRWLEKVVEVVKTAYKCLAIVNSYVNSKVDSNPATTTKNTIINDQNGTTGANFRYGMHSASDNSCETIAVHNAKVLEGIDSTLSETMSDFQSAGAMIGDGYFGSNPYAIGKVLSNEGISYSRVGLKGMTEPGTYIISFWNDEPLKYGLHTVAVSYDGSEYTAYNLKCDGKLYPIDLSAYKRKFICGYYLE